MRFTEYLSNNVKTFMFEDIVLETKEVQDDFLICRAVATEENYIIPLGAIRFFHKQLDLPDRIELIA